MTEGKFLPPLPPHGLRRPSLLAVGPFHVGGSDLERIVKAIQEFSRYN